MCDGEHLGKKELWWSEFPATPSCNTWGSLLNAALRKGYARWAVLVSIIDTPSAPLSWKYHRSSLLKSADMCKEGTACVLFIYVRNFSWWDNQNKLSRKAISSLAELHTMGISYYSSVNSQFSSFLKCTNSTLNLSLGTRGMISVMDWRLHAFLPYPFFLQGTVSVF